MQPQWHSIKHSVGTQHLSNTCLVLRNAVCMQAPLASCFSNICLGFVMFFEACFSPTLLLLTWLRHCPENVLCRGCPQHRHHCSCDLHGGGKVGTISRWIYAIGFPASLPRPVCWDNKTPAQERFAVGIRQALPKCLLKWMTQSAVLQVAESESVGENLDCLERIKIGDFISPSPKCIQSDSNPAQSLQSGLVSTSHLAQDGFGPGRGLPGCLGGQGSSLPPRNAFIRSQSCMSLTLTFTPYTCNHVPCIWEWCSLLF